MLWAEAFPRRQVVAPDDQVRLSATRLWALAPAAPRLAGLGWTEDHVIDLYRAFYRLEGGIPDHTGMRAVLADVVRGKYATTAPVPVANWLLAGLHRNRQGASEMDTAAWTAAVGEDLAPLAYGLGYTLDEAVALHAHGQLDRGALLMLAGLRDLPLL